MSKRYWFPLSHPTIGWQEVHDALDVLESAQTTMGERVEAFEDQFAQYVGAEHAVMVNSGSSADLLMAFAVKHGLDPRMKPTVLIPAVTWPTHVWSWYMAGFNVRFVDVDGVNTNTDIIKAGIHSDYDMVSVPHLMGIPADLTGLVGRRLTEDCCEALGANVGGRGEMATWSFFFSHHMTTMEGGAITTNDPALASLLRSLRSHGWARHEGRDPYEFVTMGFNVRPTEISAAIGLVQLQRLDEFNKLRGENYRTFTGRLDGCPGLEFPKLTAGANPFGLPMFVDDRDGLAKFLEEEGVETRPILGGNLTRQPAFKRWAGGHFPGADRVHDHGLYIGLHPLEECGITEVADLIARYLG